MIIYISGPITNVENYKEKFDRAEEMLKEQGHIVLNTTILPKGLSYEQYMRIDLTLVDVADAIFMLKGWENSKGANAEFHTAKSLGKILMFEKGDRYDA